MYMKITAFVFLKEMLTLYDLQILDTITLLLEKVSKYFCSLNSGIDVNLIEVALHDALQLFRLITCQLFMICDHVHMNVKIQGLNWDLFHLNKKRLGLLSPPYPFNPPPKTEKKKE